MVKPEWGTKRSCPKCSTRFYDLQHADPVTCINCGYAWVPEPILKSKQVLPFEAAKPAAAEGAEAELAAEDLELVDVDAEEPSVEHDVDIDTDDTLSDAVGGGEEEER